MQIYRAFFYLSIIIGAMALETASSQSGDVEDTLGVTSEGSLIVEPLFEFSSNMYKSLRDEKKNLIFSPISIQSALNMLLIGTEEGSATEKELLKGLGYSKINPDSMDKIHQSYGHLMALFSEILAIRQNSSNSRSDYVPLIDMRTIALLKEELKVTFLEKLNKYYKTIVKQVPGTDKTKERASLLEYINDWGRKAGFGEDLLQESDLSAHFSTMLMSAIRLEASWWEEFNETEEPDELFFNHGSLFEAVKNRTVLVNSDMSGEYVQFTKKPNIIQIPRNQYIITAHKKKYQELSELEFSAVDIALKGNVTFTIFEPTSSGTGKELGRLVDNLLSLDKDKKQTLLAKAFEVIDSKEAQAHIVRIQFPKFRFENDIDLIEPLKNLGIKRIFNQNESEITKIAKNKQMIDKAAHKALIQVNKVGLTASAITSVRAYPMSLHFSSHPIRIYVLNPFMFVVRYNKVPLFMGQLVEL